MRIVNTSEALLCDVYKHVNTEKSILSLTKSLTFVQSSGTESGCLQYKRVILPLHENKSVYLMN